MRNEARGQDGVECAVGKGQTLAICHEQVRQLVAAEAMGFGKHLGREVQPNNVARGADGSS